MDEADILADKIAIMSKGRLRAIGKSIRLKNKFGTGYRLTIILRNDAGQVGGLQKTILDMSADVTVEEREYVGRTQDSESSEMCRLVFCCPSIESMKRVIGHLEKITADTSEEASRHHGIISFGLAQTTLEDVFLKTVRGVE